MTENKHNYVVIQKWMPETLKLKGNDLLVYAIIYGFSQDGESKFYGSRRYIANFLNMSLSTVDRSLSNLISKNYIIKETESKNGVIFNSYTVNFSPIENE